MVIGFRTRCHPGTKLAQTLAQWIGCHRAIKNAKHDELLYLLWLRKRAILSPSFRDPDPQDLPFPLDQTYHQFKTGLTPWLSEVPAQILRNAATVHHRAWLNHWKNPAHFRKPRRQRKWEGQSVLLTAELFRFVGPGRVELGTRAHPIGVLPFVAHRDIGMPRSLTVSRTRYGHWFLSYATDALQGPGQRRDGALPDLPRAGLAQAGQDAGGGADRVFQHGVLGLRIHP
jgi:hypothetical protein